MGDDDDPNDTIIELNVGGQLVDVPRSTLVFSPYFAKLLAKCDGDSSQRIFLNFPPDSFKLLIDQLRLIRSAPPSVHIDPPTVPLVLIPELENMAWCLGIGYILEAAVQGQSQ